MKILFVVPYVPSRIYVRPYQLIRGLVARGHQVHLATLTTAPDDQALLQHLEDEGVHVHAQEQPLSRSLWNAAAALPSRTPLQAVYSWQPALANSIAQLLAVKNGAPPFEVVHVEHLRGARYGLFVHELRQQPAFAHLRKTPLIWDSVDSITHLFRQASQSSQKITSRFITRLELPRTARYEAFLAGQFDHMLVTSPVDKQAFQHAAGATHDLDSITILPNGVDLQYFQPDLQVSRVADTLVISGKMSYHANVTMVHHLVHEILPLVWRERPQVKIWIVGKNPGRSIQQLDSHPNISVTGTVPDLRPYIQKAALAVAPIQYGAGIQNKVLEAMACGTPVVCTPLAVSALQATAGQHLMVADQPAAFARAILDLLDNQALREKIGQAGRAFVETEHDWDRIAAALERIYIQVGEGLQANATINNSVM